MKRLFFRFREKYMLNFLTGIIFVLGILTLPSGACALETPRETSGNALGSLYRQKDSSKEFEKIRELALADRAVRRQNLQKRSIKGAKKLGSNFQTSPTILAFYSKTQGIFFEKVVRIESARPRVSRGSACFGTDRLLL